MEVVFWNAVVVAQMSLGLVPEVLDAIDVVALAIGVVLLMVDAAMSEARDVEVVVGEVAVGIDH